MRVSGRFVMACIGLVLMIATIGGVRARPKPSVTVLAHVTTGPAKARDGLRVFAVASGVASAAAQPDDLVRSGLARLLSGRSLDGIDVSGRLHLVIAEIDGALSCALLAPVADGKRIENDVGAGPRRIGGGWVAVGPEPLLDGIGRPALDTIAAQRSAAALTFALDLTPTVGFDPRFRDASSKLMTSLAEMVGDRGAQLVGKVADWLSSLTAQVDRLVVTIGTTPDTGWIDLALTPTPDSELAKFVAAQRPTDYALLGRLPPAPAPLMLAGTLALGPYHARYLALLADVFGGNLDKPGFDALGDASNGAFAGAEQLEPGTGMRMTWLFGLSDPRAAGEAFSRVLDFAAQDHTFDAAGMSVTVKRQPGSTLYDRVVLRGYDVTVGFPKQLPIVRALLEEIVPARLGTLLATFDGTGMIAMAPDASAEARRGIDAARGKAHFTPAPRLVRWLAESRTRRDSAAILFDPAATLSAVTGQASSPQPVLITFGFADRRVHVRVELQPAALGTLVRNL